MVAAPSASPSITAISPPRMAPGKEPTPPDEPLVVRSQITRVKDTGEVGSKATVQVDTSLYQLIGGHEKLLATSTGIFKKLGALRALPGRLLLRRRLPARRLGRAQGAVQGRGGAERRNWRCWLRRDLRRMAGGD